MCAQYFYNIVMLCDELILNNLNAENFIKWPQNMIVYYNIKYHIMGYFKYIHYQKFEVS